MSTDYRAIIRQNPSLIGKEPDPLADGLEAQNPADPLDNVQEDQKKLAMNLAFKKAEGRTPDAEAEVQNVAREAHMPVEYTRRNLDEVKRTQKRRVLNYGELIRTNPNLSQFLTDEKNTALAQDDIEPLKRMEDSMIKVRVREEEGLGAKLMGYHPATALWKRMVYDTVAKPVMDDATMAFQSGVYNLSSSLTHTAIANGALPVEQGAELLKQINERRNALQRKLPEYVHETRRMVVEEGKDINEAVARGMQGWHDLKEGEIIEGLKGMLVGGAVSAAEAADFVYEAALRPKGILFTSTEQLLNSAPGLALGFAGGKLGAATGAFTGPAAPLAVPGLGFTGFIGGTFIGQLMTEYGAWIDQKMGERGVDTSDPQQVAAAYNDVKFMTEARAEAKAKGITTPGVDTLFNALAGKFLKFGKGTTFIQKAKGAAAELGVQGTGEAVSEAAGQLAARGEVEKVDWGEAMFEGISSGGTTIAQAPIAAAYREIRYSNKTSNAAQDVAFDAKDALKAQEAALAMQEQIAAVQESKTKDRVPGRVAEYLNGLRRATGQGAELFFQADDLEAHWQERGENAFEMAEELFGENGARLFQEAKKLDTPLSIPWGEFIEKAASQESVEALVSIARSEHAHMSANEAKEFNENLPGIMRELSEEALAEDSDRQEFEQRKMEAKERVQEQLIEANVPESVAKRYAELFPASIEALPKNYGIDLETVADEFARLRIERQGRQEVFNQDVTSEQTWELQKKVPVPEGSLNVVTLQKSEGPSEQSSARQHLRQRNDHSKKRIIVDKKGFKKLQHKKRPDELATVYDAVLDNLPGLLKDSIYLRSAESRKGQRFKYDYYYAPVESEGQLYAVKFTVRDTKNGKFLWDIHPAKIDLGQDTLEETTLGILEELGITRERVREIQESLDRTIVPASQEQNASNDPQGRTMDMVDFVDAVKTIDVRLRNQEGQQTLFQELQAELDQGFGTLGFYSRLEEIVNEKMGKSATKQQVEAILKDVKAEEREWSRVDEFLKGKDKVLKSELIEHLRANRLQIQEVEKRSDEALAIEEEQVLARINELVREERGGKDFSFLDAFEKETPEPSEELTRLQARYKELVDGRVNKEKPLRARHNIYTLPGGDNYREILFTLPEIGTEPVTTLPEGYTIKQERVEPFAEEGAYDGYNVYDEKGQFAGSGRTEVEAITPILNDLSKYKSRDKNYKNEAHFLEPNIFAFVRINERVDSEGKRVLFVEEIQSDWHQQGRKHGYKETFREEISDLPEGAEVISEPVGENTIRFGEEKPGDLRYRVVMKDGSFYPGTYPDRDSAVAGFISSYNRNVSQENRRGVPDAPFKKNWHEFAFKRVLRMAAEQGFDKVAWTTGQQQGERYGNEERRNEGMKGFYDKMIPTFAKKFGKKFKAKYGSTFLPNAGEIDYGEVKLNDGVRNELRAVQNLGFNRAAEAAQAILQSDDWKTRFHFEDTDSTSAIEQWRDEIIDTHKKVEVHSLEITDKMRETALGKGFTLFQQDEGNPAHRGSITFMDDETVIRLTESANLSTFLHETGHFYLDLIGRLADSHPNNEALQKDYGKVLGWLGVADRSQIKREHHEKWAEAVETYFMNGKAPSKGLKKAFDAFRGWLLQIYGHLRNRKEQFTPEVAEVMDRMLAADEHVKEAADRVDSDSMFEGAQSAEELGMSKALFSRWADAKAQAQWDARQTLTLKLLEKIKRRKSKEYKALRKQFKAQVEEEIKQHLGFKIPQIIRTGEDFDGNKVGLPGQDLRLNREELKARYGNDIAQRLPKGISVTGRDNGMPLDLLADMFGVESSDDLIDLLERTPSKAEYINQRVEFLIEQADPDLLKEAHVEQEAIDAFYNDSKEERLRLELKFLVEEALPTTKKVVGQLIKRVPTKAQAKQEAAKIIAQIKTADIKPYLYQRAERKNAREAAAAFERGDFEAAFTAKQKELLNFELYRQANAAKENMRKSLQKWKKLYGNDEKIAKSREMGLVNTARSILSLYGLGKKTEKSPEQYLEFMKKYDIEGYTLAVERIQSEVEEIGPVTEMSYGQFVKIKELVDGLWAQAKTEKEVFDNNNRVAFDTALNDLITEASGFVNDGNKAKYNEDAGAWQKTKRGLLSARAFLRRMESWVDSMSLGNRESAFWRYLWNPVREAVDTFQVDRSARLKELNDILKEFDELGGAPIEARELADSQGRSFKFRNKGQLIHAILHSGNSSNLEKLLVGREWGTIDEEGNLDTSKWDAFLNRAFEQGLVTKKDMDAIQKIWDLNEALKPQAQAAHKEVYGYYFKEITAEPIKTPFGTYRGGYTPAKADPDLVEDASIREDLRALDEQNHSGIFPSTGRGFTFKRVKYYAPLKLDMNQMPAHVESVLKFAHLQPTIRKVARIANNKEFRAAIGQVDSEIVKDMIIPWLQRTAQQRVSEPSTSLAGRWFDSGARWLRNAAGINIMAANIPNTAEQFTGFSIAAVKLKRKKSLADAFQAYITNPKQVGIDISEKSKFMKERVFTQLFDIKQRTEDMVVNPGKYRKATRALRNNAYIFQSTTQNIVDNVVWTAAYNESIEEGRTEEQAVRDADSMVRLTQGSFEPVDVSRYETGKPWTRMFTMFTSYFNMLSNMLGTEFAKTIKEHGFRDGAPQLLQIYFFGMFIPAYVSRLIQMAASGEFDEDDDDKIADDLLTNAITSQFNTASAMIPVAGHLASLAANQFNDKWYDDELRISPVLSHVTQATTVIPRVGYKLWQGKDIKKGDVRDALTLIGLATGTPVLPLYKPFSYATDVATGKVKPHNEADYVRGLLTGRGGGK